MVEVPLLWARGWLGYGGARDYHPSGRGTDPELYRVRKVATDGN